MTLPTPSRSNVDDELARALYALALGDCDRETMTSATVSAVVRMTSATGGAFRDVEPERRMISVTSSASRLDAVDHDHDGGHDYTVEPIVLSSRDHAAIDEAGDAEQAVTFTENGRWSVALPVRFHGVVYGALFLASMPRPLPANPRVARAVALTTQAFGAHLARTERLAHLEAEASVDPLTGLDNRRCFERRLDAEIRRATRHGRALTVALLDLDGFKAVNDRFGYLVGDTVLRDVARTLRRSLRESDIVCRWGGDEFALILPETGAFAEVAAPPWITRLERAVAGIDLSEIDPSLRMGFSWASGVLPDDGSDAEEIFANVCARLRRAKVPRAALSAEVPT